MKRHAARPAAFLMMLAFAVPFANDAHAQNRSEEWRERDVWQRAPAVLDALGLAAGSEVADVGAGWGYFTAHLSRAVGAAGRVYAVDISDRAIRELSRLVREDSLENVRVVRGEVDDPTLAPRSIDAALIVNAYHDMVRHRAMLTGIRLALRPGGRLVIVDMAPYEVSADAPRAEQVAEHELEVGIAERELRSAGFEIAERVDVFTERCIPGVGAGPFVQWMLVARRPRAGAR